MGLLIGNLIPDENQFWELYVLLKEIFLIITLRIISFDKINRLRNLIESHHTLYLSLSIDGLLKPKHHFVTHYPDIILKVGPLIHFWSMRYEAKHRISKRIANSISSRKNITFSIAMRHHLFFLDRFLNNKGFSPVLEFSKKFNNLSTHNHTCSHSPCFLKSNFNTMKCVKSVSINGSEFKIKQFIEINNVNEGPLFGLIIDIYILEKDVFFYIQEYITQQFYKKYFAYEICETEKFYCYDSSLLRNFVIQHTKIMPCGKRYLSHRNM